jgi:hypothetical protein
MLHSGTCLKRNRKGPKFVPLQEGSFIQVPEIFILVTIVSSPPKKGFLYTKRPFKTVFTVGYVRYYYLFQPFIIQSEAFCQVQQHYGSHGRSTKKSGQCLGSQIATARETQRYPVTQSLPATLCLSSCNKRTRPVPKVSATQPISEELSQLKESLFHIAPSFTHFGKDEA